MDIQTALAHLECFIGEDDSDGEVTRDEALEALAVVRAFVKSAITVTSRPAVTTTPIRFDVFEVK
jgi:hypothetical protein